MNDASKVSTCPYHKQVEEQMSKAADERTRIWEHTGKKLSFKVYSITFVVLLAVVGWNHNEMSKIGKEIKADVELIKVSQDELKTEITASVMEIKYGLRLLAEKHDNDQEKDDLKRKLLRKEMEDKIESIKR